MDAEVVVYTDAISLDNEELKEAILRKLDTIGRADFLGAVMKIIIFPSQFLEPMEKLLQQV